MKLKGIGLGPGDPELLTVKAVKILEDADIVIVPQSDKTGRSIAKDIVEHYINEDKIFMYFFPMTNEKAELDRRYSELADKVKEFISDGKKTVYVTIGDAPVFSTFNYLAGKLKERGVKTEFIPGISAFSATYNRLGISMCEKGENVCIIEMPDNFETLDFYYDNFDSIVLMKVHKKLDVLRDYIKLKKPAEAWLASRATLPDEKFINLNTDEADGAKTAYLSTAIIRKKS